MSTDEPEKEDPKTTTEEALNAQAIEEAIDMHAAPQADPKDALIAELTDLLKRKQAEFENSLKRMEATATQQTRFAAERLIKKLIPVIDNFDLALKHGENAQDCLVGVKMIQRQMHDMLANEGITNPELVGKPFNPQLALAIKTIHDPKAKDNIVVEEISKCYMLHGSVIQHGKVIVSKKEKPEN